MRHAPAALLLLAAVTTARGTPAGEGALREAIRAGDVARAEQLLRAGENVNAHDALGSTPLLDAAWAGKPEMVRLLLEHGALVDARHAPSLPGEPGSTALDYAVRTGNAAVAQLLLARGASLRAGLALHAAAARGDAAMLRVLLAAGARPEEKDRDGLTPLRLAAARGRTDVLELLLGNGDSGAGEALEDAAGNGQTGAVRWLLEHGPRTAASPARLAALVGKASARGDLALARLLVEHGAAVNQPNAAGATPLHEAARKGLGGMAEMLLAAGGDVRARDQYGATPLHEAALSGQAELVELLLAHGADVNARETVSGATALYDAASLGRAEAVRVLLEHGADAQLANRAGQDPLRAATENGFLDVAARLQAARAR